MTQELDPATGYPRMSPEDIKAFQRNYGIKDSGRREDFPSGMRRDVEDDKPDYTLVFDGPLVDRLAAHLTKGAQKYGRRNWQLAESLEEAERFQRSFARHMKQYLDGEQDEDHFAAMVFNLNACEHVLQKCGYRTVQTFRENMERSGG